jgi:hypothetical protein
MSNRAREEQIAAYLRTNPPFPLVAAPPPPYVRVGLTGYGPPQRPTAGEIGRWFLRDAEFRALELGNWLGTTDGEIIAGAIESFLPPLYREDAELLVDALKFAAALQQTEGREVAGAWALGSIAVAGILWFGIKSGRLQPAA